MPEAEDFPFRTRRARGPSRPSPTAWLVAVAAVALLLPPALVVAASPELRGTWPTTTSSDDLAQGNVST
ncbi:MAG: hypothetical protein ACKO9B_18875, partial [Planctomycetota bacterium]